MAKDAVLAHSPRALASDGTTVVVVDDRGGVLAWPFPAAPTVAFPGRDTWGPVVADPLEERFLVAGGWDPGLDARSASGLTRTASLSAFDGRLVGVCVASDAVWMLGSDLDPDQRAKEGPALRASQALRLDRSGRSEKVDLELVGMGRGLACGRGFVAALDGGERNRVKGLVDGALKQWNRDAPTAIVGTGAHLWVAERGGVVSLDVRSGERRSFAARSADSADVQELLVVGERVLARTSVGVEVWPGGALWSRGAVAPVALANHGDHVLVLWEDDRLEAREVATGDVVAAGAVPRQK